MLWHLLLWPLTRITNNPIAMQSLQFLVATLTLALLWFRSPFKSWELALICSSYPLLHDFTVMSRSYGLGVLLLLLFVHWEKHYRAKPWLPWLLLALLVNLHFFLFLCSLVLASVWAYSEREQWRAWGAGGTVYLAATVFAALTMARRLQPEYPGQKVWNYGGTEQRLTEKLASFSSGFLPVTEFHTLKWFDPQLPPLLGAQLAPLVFILVVFLLRRHKIAAFGMLALSGAMIAFFYFLHGGYSWHVGLLYVTLVALVWMLRNRGLEPGPGWILASLLLLNTVGGVKACWASKIRPISGCQESAAWIRESRLEQEFWIGYPMFRTSGVATLLGRPFYYPECDAELSYTEWRRPSVPEEEYLLRLEARLQKNPGREPYLVVEGIHEPFLNQLRTEFDVIEVARPWRFEAENYALYRLLRKERYHLYGEAWHLQIR